MIRLIIIADDFTGGLDTGVQFARKGIRTRVITDPGADYSQAANGYEVLVVVAETRHLPPREAYDEVYRIVEKSRALGVPHIYKKTDSGLRGNIGAELTAALQASGERSLVFLPSMPGIGRVTVQGVHYIDGVPVAESIFGRDPFEPVTESDVVQLIAQQSEAEACSVRAGCLPDAAGIIVADAQTDAELRQTGELLAASGRLRVTAGCAGFASVLPDLLGLKTDGRPEMPVPDPGLFVLCGSVNPITQRQLAYAERNGFTRLHIAPEQKLDSAYFSSPEGQKTLEEWRAACAQNPWIILDANDTDDSNCESSAYAQAHGMTTEDIRQRISDTLGRILPEMLSGIPNRSLLITGGDTLLQCMKHMQVSQMEPLQELFPGIVLSTFRAEGRDRHVISKSGGFGEETLLCDLKKLIENQQHTAKEV